VGQIGLMAAAKLEKFQQEIGAKISHETLRASVYFNLAKIVHYAARFVMQHTAAGAWLVIVRLCYLFIFMPILFFLAIDAFTISQP
jgi:hypothetical protein